MPYHLVYLLDRSDLHVRALDSHDWRNTSLHQARDVLNLDVWETSNVFCPHLDGGLDLCLGDHLLRTGCTLFVSKLRTDPGMRRLHSGP